MRSTMSNMILTTQPAYFRSLDSSVTELTGNELAKATFPSGGRVPNKTKQSCLSEQREAPSAGHSRPRIRPIDQHEEMRPLESPVPYTVKSRHGISPPTGPTENPNASGLRDQGQRLSPIMTNVEDKSTCHKVESDTDEVRVCNAHGY